MHTATRDKNPLFAQFIVLQGGFAALHLELLETIKTVTAGSYDFPGFGDTVQLIGQFQQPHLVEDYFLFIGHLIFHSRLQEYYEMLD